MELTQDDIDKLVQAKKLVDEVASHVDCGYCRGHLEEIMWILSNMIDDATGISKFNLLYSDDEEALNKLRELLQDEAVMRLLSIASRMVGLFRRVHGRH